MEVLWFQMSHHASRESLEYQGDFNDYRQGLALVFCLQ